MSTEREREEAPLLPSNDRPYPAESSSYFKRLDMLPSTRDKICLTSIFVGIALFLPLTWYMVLSGDLSAMGWFAVHPPMQSLAITAFILGITPLQPPTPPSSSSTTPSKTPSTRQTRLHTHQTIILGLALPLMALGTSAMWYNKHLHSTPHFTTWHGKFGLGVVVWVVLQALIGGGSVWFGGRFVGGGGKWVYKYHRISGYILLTLTLLTAHLGGAHSTWALGRPMQGVRVAAFWVGLPLIWLGFVARARPNKMKVL